MDSEKRNFARLDMRADAKIHLGNQNFEVEVENLSVKGAYVTVVSPMKTDDVVAFTICDTPTCNLKAKVTRVTEKGVGLQFEKTLFD